MNKFKRILAIILSVCLLSCTVNTTYFNAINIDKVEATGVIEIGGLSAATIWQICLLVGSVFFISWAAGEVIDNQEEIARAGKNFIDSVKEIPEGFLSKITDISNGQDYVFGSEAFELIKDTPWEVIQGGAPNNNNNNDDDDNKNGIINLCKSASQYVGNFFALGSTWVIAHASELYQKWVNGEEMTEAELAAIEPLISGYCNQYDVAAQWSGAAFDYSLNVNYSFDAYDSKGKNFSHHDYVLRCLSSYSMPVAVHYYYDASINAYVIEFLRISNNNLVEAVLGVETSTVSYDGAAPKRYPYSSRSTFSFNIADNYKNFSFAYSANCPVFASRIDAENYLKGTGDVTNALNYSKIYRHADWLSENWAGQLVDPFTNIGLTLNQLIELMKKLGLRAVGNNLSPDDLADLIRKSLPDVNPDLLPDETPVTIPDPAPGTDPVYYPSPDAHPIPAKPTPNPNPGIDPDPEPNPGIEIIDIDDIVPDTVSSFSDISGTLKRKFPFSLPWDIHYLLTSLASTAKTPVYYLPLVIERWGIDELIVIDMSDFEDISRLSRAMLSLIWAYGLINWTVKIVSVRKEE